MYAWLFGLTLTLLLTCGPGRVFADQVALTLEVPNSGIADDPGPYGKVTVKLTSSTTATVTFKAFTDGGYCYSFGGHGAVGLNVNAGTFSVGAVTGTNSHAGSSPGPYKVTSNQNEDGFGRFNLNINSFDGFAHSATKVTFTLTDTSGTWASAANVLTGNVSGYEAAARVFATHNYHAACDTGFAANSPVVTPEPDSLALLGLGMAVTLVGFSQRQRTP
jgi:hypothetical protein